MRELALRSQENNSPSHTARSVTPDDRFQGELAASRLAPPLPSRNLHQFSSLPRTTQASGDNYGAVPNWNRNRSPNGYELGEPSTLPRYSAGYAPSKTQNVAVVEPRLFPRATKKKPWQPQEIRSQVSWRPPANPPQTTRESENEIFPWQPNQSVIEDRNEYSPRVTQEPIKKEEEEVDYMGLQDHYDWIKQQQRLLREQQACDERQKWLLNNYVYLPGQHGNQGDRNVKRNQPIRRQNAESSFGSTPGTNQSENPYETLDNHTKVPSTAPWLPRKSRIKANAVQVLPEMQPGTGVHLRHVTQESSTDDVTENPSGDRNHDDAVPSYIHHERFRSISPIVEYLNDSSDNINTTLEVKEENRSHRSDDSSPVTLIL